VSAILYDERFWCCVLGTFGVFGVIGLGGVDLAGALCWSDGIGAHVIFDILGTVVDDICLARLGRVFG